MAQSTTAQNITNVAMDVTPLIPKGRQVITGYGNGGFQINHQFISGSLILFGDHNIPWPVIESAPLTLGSLQTLFDHTALVELLLIGTGKKIIMPDNAVRQRLKTDHIAVDIMDTGAACRTYNLLIAEERKVAAALIAI